jgi:pimeloyl-ACP methyl ester carboxylesterase
VTSAAIAFEPARDRIAIPGGDIAVLRFGRPGAPPLLYAHANGFCASAYRRMLEHVGPRFDVFAVDLRGHGRTTLATDRTDFKGLDLYGADIGALLTAIRRKSNLSARWTLSGHSLGAVAVTLAAVGRVDVAALRLVEPVAMPPFWYWAARTPVWPLIAPRLPLVAGARNRRAAFPDRASVLASYRTKPLFASWVNGVLEDYLTDGLAETAAGVSLSCAPRWEAANFAAQAHDFWGAVKKAPAPIAALVARHPSSTTPPGSIRRFQRLGVEIVLIDGVSHLAPFENPAAVAGFLAAA